MAAKAWGAQQKSVEEVFFQNDSVSLCLMIHRRAKTMRVIDFRAGPSNAKRMFVLALAAGGAQPAVARGGGGPPGWTMTLSYCRRR